MDIQLHEITVREQVEGYVDDGHDGVRGYGGALDIRSPYQREFVCKEKQRNAVIESIAQEGTIERLADSRWALTDLGQRD